MRVCAVGSDGGIRQYLNDSLQVVLVLLQLDRSSQCIPLLVFLRLSAPGNRRRVNWTVVLPISKRLESPYAMQYESFLER